MPNMKKRFGIDPVIVMMIAAVVAAVGLFALAAYCIGNIVTAPKPAAVTNSTTMKAVSAGRIVGITQDTELNKGSNQLADGSVILKVKMSDVKIHGMGLDSTNR